MDHYSKVWKRFEALRKNFADVVEQNNAMKSKRDKQNKPLIAKVRKLEAQVQSLENLLATRARLDRQLPDEERLFIEQRMQEELDNVSVQ